jgi:hypothetical protein
MFKKAVQIQDTRTALPAVLNTLIRLPPPHKTTGCKQDNFFPYFLLTVKKTTSTTAQNRLLEAVRKRLATLHGTCPAGYRQHAFVTFYLYEPKSQPNFFFFSA